jgi:hypothetical protein
MVMADTADDPTSPHHRRVEYDDHLWCGGQTRR